MRTTVIEYKGSQKVLSPEEKVWELNLNTGIVQEAELEEVMPTLSQRLATLVTHDKLKKVFRVVERKDRFVLFAASHYKACVKFKKVFQGTKLKIRF